MKREIKRAPDLLESAPRPCAVGPNPRLILHCPASSLALCSVCPAFAPIARSHYRVDFFRADGRMPNVMESVMQKSVNGIFILILCYVLLPAELCAQTDKQADEAVSDTSLAVCDNEQYSDEDTVHPCNRYIEANVEDHADTIKWLLEVIQDRESSSKRASDALYARDQIVQWTLVVLALLTTIAAAITKGYPELKVYGIDFAIIPIILAASSAAVTSLSVYYQFDEYRIVNQSVAYDLEELEVDIHFAIFRHASSRDRDAGKIDENAINGWLERFETIMQRYVERESGNGA